MTIQPEAWFVVLQVMRVKRVHVSKRGNAINCVTPNLLKSCSTNRENGYSLIELIVTIILIGIAFPGLLGFFASSMIDTVKNDVINEAVLLAGEKMEQITADKNEPTRGIDYITTPNQYPSESLGQYTRGVVIQTKIIDNISVIEVIVSITHPVISNSFTLTHLFTDYYGS